MYIYTIYKADKVNLGLFSRFLVARKDIEMRCSMYKNLYLLLSKLLRN